MKKLLIIPIIILLSISVLFLENCKKRDISTNDYTDSQRVKTNPSFNQEEIELILEGDSADIMRVLKIHSIVFDSLTSSYDTITNNSDSLQLRRISTYIEPDSTDTILTRLIDRMYSTVNDPLSPGVGIAAPQVGINKNIIWVQRLDKTGDPFEVYLNTKIVAYSNKEIVFFGDGCLSIPGMSGNTDRYSSVCIEYDLIDGTHHTEVVEGYSGMNFTSVIFQHEIDHLNGIIFLDRLHDYTKSN